MHFQHFYKRIKNAHEGGVKKHEKWHESWKRVLVPSHLVRKGERNTGCNLTVSCDCFLLISQINNEQDYSSDGTCGKLPVFRSVSNQTLMRVTFTETKALVG